MLLDWFNVHEAAAVGAALADELAPQTAAKSSKILPDFLRRAEREVRALRLNFYKRAKLANSFKWRLIEQGVEKKLADELTQALVMQLLTNTATPPVDVSTGGTAAMPPSGDRQGGRAGSGKVKQLLAQGNECFARGAYEQAMSIYRELVELKPRSADAHNNLGATLYKLDRFGEADEHLRQAIKIKPDYPEALSNLGALRQWQGHFVESATVLRRALKLRPNYLDARSLLGKTLALQGRSAEAQAHIEKVLKIAPRHMEALLGMGQVATMEGRFEDAEGWFKRAMELESDPKFPSALAALPGLRRMTADDAAWLKRAEDVAASGIAPSEESSLRFSIGKYFDDIGDFGRAFRSYRRANELARSLATTYRPDVRTQFVDDLIRVHSQEFIAGVGDGASDSNKPVFVVGMPRSGTTLAEQIIASHPAAAGAGELEFWINAGRQHEAEIRQGLLSDAIRKQLAQAYLHTLSQQSVEALRVVDKAPINSDYLGVIHSVFPNARIIHMRRNPIDTCLSCYFQPFFPQALGFTMDLADLDHYYRQHQRLMAHWRAVLPPGTMLELQYEELTADQTGSTRKILEFLGLDWDERCLEFYKTARGVATSSTWQVRQKVYRTSVERWRKYEKFIGPLMGLGKLDA